MIMTDSLSLLQALKRQKFSFTPMERRRYYVVLCRAGIGHAYFAHGCVLKGELRPRCCNTPLTVRYVLPTCSKYAHIRKKHFSFNCERYYSVPEGMYLL